MDKKAKVPALITPREGFRGADERTWYSCLGLLGSGTGAEVLVAEAIAGAIGGRAASRSEMAQLKEQLDQHAAALEDAENNLVSQSTQLAELQDRLDFAERLLVQSRERDALGPGDKQGVTVAVYAVVPTADRRACRRPPQCGPPKSPGSSPR